MVEHKFKIGDIVQSKAGRVIRVEAISESGNSFSGVYMEDFERSGVAGDFSALWDVDAFEKVENYENSNDLEVW